MQTLEGVLVIALEQAVAGPVATARLADSGARVIKLEQPVGDFSRYYDDYVLGQSSYYVWINRGKESCRVDLKTEADLALARRMLARADVFVQNIAPDATKRLGIASKDLRKHHPKLIVCDISGYGPNTPDYLRKAYDLLIQAEVGLASVTGNEGSGPSRVGISICDISTGNAAYAAILEALFRRERTGDGSHIQISLFDTMAEMMNVPYLARRYGDVEPRRGGLAHPSIAPYGLFRMKDGELVIAVQSEREWRTFCAEVLRIPELANDPRFRVNVRRIANRNALDAYVQQTLAERGLAEVQRDLDRARIAYGRISTLQNLVNHANATTVTVDTPNGQVELLAPGAIVDGQRSVARCVPRLGEHDETLRAEFANSES